MDNNDNIIIINIIIITIFKKKGTYIYLWMIHVDIW